MHPAMFPAYKTLQPDPDAQYCARLHKGYVPPFPQPKGYPLRVANDPCADVTPDYTGKVQNLPLLHTGVFFQFETRGSTGQKGISHKNRGQAGHPIPLPLKVLP